MPVVVDDHTDQADIVVIAETVSQLTRAFAKVKAKTVQNAQDEVEWASHVLLRSLSTGGPMRASALADSVQSDPSTVSRQVASLVKEGLIERRADPGDGRACLLVPTEPGRAIIAQRDQARLAFYADMLDDWGADEVNQFAALLARFGDAYENASSAWMSKRESERTSETGGATR
jgi:DNA-binding MarR family transcriptional regulator